jgi:hypothetical protein
MIYFIQQSEDGPIKIGRSCDPESRLKEMQTGNPDPLHILGCCADMGDTEQKLHKRFKHIHIQGEWFEPADDLMAFIHKVCPKLWIRTPIKPNLDATDDGKLLTVEELADALKVPKHWIYNRTRQTGLDAIPLIRVGKYCRFKLNDVIEWFKLKTYISDEGVEV